MKYFLGYCRDNNFIPIKITDENAPVKIADLVKYTNQFDTEEELIEQLLNYDQELKFDEPIYYLKQDGSKGKYTYIPISNGKIYTKKYSKFFNYIGIYNYIHKNINNIEFIDSLFNFVIENSNVIGIIYNYLNSLDRIKFNIFINKLLKYPIDSNLRIAIEEYKKVSQNDELGLYQKASNIKRIITNTSSIMKLLYMSFNKEIKFSQSPAFVRNMENLYIRVFNYNRDGDAYLFDYDNYQDITLEAQITYFLHSFIYAKDRNNKYKLDSYGNNIYNGSILFKLGKFLAEYDDYRLYQEKKMMEEHQNEYATYENIKNPEEEEFLTKEDFLRIGIDPEENGYKRK